MTEATPPVEPTDDHVVDDNKVRPVTKYETSLRARVTAAEAAAAQARTDAEARIAAALAERDSAVAAERTAAAERLKLAELRAHAAKHGMHSGDGLKLLDTSGVKLTDAGEIEGADALFAAAKTSHPWLFKAPTTSSTAVVPPTGDPKAKAATEMTLEEWRAQRAKLVSSR
jgi:multidrug efflux pump subunit AcrA (membrane-fusion protein)